MEEKFAPKFTESSEKFDLRFTELNNEINTDVEDVFVVVDTSKVPRYKGEYEVTPTVDGGTLPTNQKFMEKDLVVNPIPVYETTNTSGGQTVYIAKE